MPMSDGKLRWTKASRDQRAEWVLEAIGSEIVSSKEIAETLLDQGLDPGPNAIYAWLRDLVLMGKVRRIPTGDRGGRRPHDKFVYERTDHVSAEMLELERAINEAVA